VNQTPHVVKGLLAELGLDCEHVESSL